MYGHFHAKCVISYSFKKLSAILSLHNHYLRSKQSMHNQDTDKINEYILSQTAGNFLV